jgi:hypothetical protein
MAQSLWDRNFRLFTARIVTQGAFRNRRSAEHRQILAALQRQDPDAVEAAYRRHMVRSGIDTVAFLRTLIPESAPPPGSKGTGMMRPGIASAKAPVRGKSSADSEI